MRCAMSRMFKAILPLLIIVSASGSGWSAAADEPSEMLARAEELYYEADFAKSIELLLQADELLSRQSGRLQEKTAVKLQLALGYIGLNDSTRAKTYLGQLYALDADHRIDPQVFSPKVIKLADEARVEQNAVRCRSVVDDAQRQLGNGNVDAVVKLIASNGGKCLELTALNPKVADVLYKNGLDSYKKNDMEQAVQKFRSA